MSDAVRSRATLFALTVTIVLSVAKLVIGKLSGSVGIISEGLHSLLDVVSAAIAHYSVREGGKPADAEHPFGHGKFETLSSLFESLLLTVTAFFILWTAYSHLQNPEPITHEWLGMGVMAVSVVVSFIVFRTNRRLAVELDSPAIQGNALHFLADAVAGLGVLAGLIVISMTDWHWVDPLLAFAVGIYVFWISLHQLRRSLAELADRRLPENEVDVIERALDVFRSQVVDIHDLRTRKSGHIRHIDFHLVLCGKISVRQSHDLCDAMEDSLMRFFGHASINIHVEPCGHEGRACPAVCPLVLGAAPL